MPKAICLACPQIYYKFPRLFGEEHRNNHSEVTPSEFIVIEGAFDNTSYEYIQRALEVKEKEPSIIKRIQSMIEIRSITATIGKESVTINSAKGCPQGVLSPLL